MSLDHARILIADAQPEKRLAYRALLADLGAEILLAGSGIAALQHIEAGEPAVILLAIDLPDLDGLETARRLRRHPCGRQAPILFLAPCASDTQMARAYELGAVDYLQTPVIAPALRTKVRIFVDLYESHAALGRANRELESRVTERTRALEVEITQRLRAQEEREAVLVRERKKAEELSQLKDEFLATLSHELRTPLNAIFGWTHLLRTRQLDRTTQERALETIERNARAQKRLIEDLLDVSRIVAGQLALDLEEVDPLQVVEAAVTTLHPEAQVKGVQIIPMLDVQVGRVRGDFARLHQVVCNLLANAIKFTPSGGHIEITLQRHGEAIQIAVQDSGQGIDPAFLPHVFDPFRQEDGSINRRHGGLGVGLAIVHHLVKLHRGTVEAHSAGPNTGALFRVSLPARDPQPRSGAQGRPLAGPDLPALLAQVRVLVVDDDRDSRELLSAMLQGYGAEVILADSAAAALSLLCAMRPNVLVADVGMPEMDGFALIEKIRSLDPDAGGLIPAVAVTAYATPQDRQRVLQAGFHDHVTKPVEAQELALVIADLSGCLPGQSQDRRA